MAIDPGLSGGSLHCLSAFGLFGTRKKPASRNCSLNGLHCLSAFGLFGTRGIRAVHRISLVVFIAFRLLVCLGH